MYIFLWILAQVKPTKDDAKSVNDALPAPAQNTSQKKTGKPADTTSKTTSIKTNPKTGLRPVKTGISTAPEEGMENFKGIVTHELSVVSDMANEITVVFNNTANQK